MCGNVLYQPDSTCSYKSDLWLQPACCQKNRYGFISVLSQRVLLHAVYASTGEPVCVVRLSVYDVLGREVAILIDQYLNAGEQHVVWKADNLPSGFYMYRLKAGGTIQTERMILPNSCHD